MPTKMNKRDAIVRGGVVEKESAREVAMQLAHGVYPSFSQLSKRERLAKDIEAALNAERERAAKIVNDARSEGHADLRELVSRIRGTQ